MVKNNQVKNTYTRKKKGKPERDPKTNVYNVNFFVNFLSVNIVNNKSSQGKTETSESEPSDLFDKLLKGPKFNVNNKSTFGSPERSQNSRFFRQRQDTATFYRSDAEFSVSTDISNHLFKDSKDSNISFTPSWFSPADYCQVKNKLVKIAKGPAISTKQMRVLNGIKNRRKKTYNCVQKKRAGKLNKINTMLKSLPSSSTPNRPTAALKKEPWLNAVSPILPQLETSEKDSELKYNDSYMNEEENKRVEKQNCVLGMSTLIKGLENLGMETPRSKNVRELVNSMNKTGELQNCQSLLSHSPNFPNPKDTSLCLDHSEMNNEAPNHSLDDTNSSPMSSDVKRCNLDNIEEFSCTSEVSTASKEEDNREISSESQVVPCQEVSNESTEDSESRNCSLKSHNIDPDIISNIEHESGSVKTEHSESTSSNCESNSSMHIAKEISCEFIKQTEEKEEHHTLSVHEQKHVHYSNNEVSPCRESKIPNEKEKESSRIIGSNSKVLFTKKSICESQPLSDLTNLRIGTYKCERTVERYMRSMPFPKESEVSQCSVKEKYSLATKFNEKTSQINLEVGKRWRRSLMRQKLTEAKFERRTTMTTGTLVKLVKEAGILNDSMINLSRVNITCNSSLQQNNTTRFMCSLRENLESTKKSLNIPSGSPSFNLSLSRIDRRRRRKYSNDMFEIPEESSNHSNMNCSEKDIFEESILELDVKNTSMSDNYIVNKTDVYETPPILKNNLEAFSTITSRKKSRRYLMNSFVECSLLPDVDQDEDNSFISCCSRLELEDDLYNLNNNDIELLGRVGFLNCCGQKEPINFNDAFPNSVLKGSRKIGEGVYGEVFMLQRPGEDRSVIKIIPIEGSQMVNDAVQKRFDQVLSELIITEELCMLRQNKSNQTSGFCELKHKFFLQGEYPTKLLKLWKKFDDEKRSDNECPDMFGPEQLYLALELSHAGEPVESFSFRSPQQALAVFLQTTFTLAVAECELEFEHRDLHIGNVLVQLTNQKYITFMLNGKRLECPTSGTKSTVIDYTLSRMTYRGDVLYLDLEKDPELFTAEQSDYQFDIYRHMRADLNHNWRDHQPKTNIRWLHYLLDKFTDKIKYKQKKSTKLYKESMEKMIQLKDIILDFYAAADLALHLADSYSVIAPLIRT